MYRIVFLCYICFIVVLQRLENQREDRLKEQRDKIHCLVYERQTALESWYQTLIHQIYGREPYKPSEQCSESWINVPILSSMAHSSCLMDEIMTLKNTLQKMSLSQEERGMPWLQDVGLMALFLALFFIYFVWTDDEERLPEDEEESLPEDDEESLPEDDEESLPEDDEERLPEADEERLPEADQECLPGDDQECLPGDDQECLPGDDQECLPEDEEYRIFRMMMELNNI
ncbi:hypothetical protein OTU49_011103 [Cherax quadricarinatus]|uniref:Uncharacterized protein n=1 Tax=Cherax quadricarinatus TaxID=27406 RepID=A0AAW0W4K7_CHEQU